MSNRADHVTVVLPTHRRRAALEHALRALARQRDPGVAWDVVVVENDALPGRLATDPPEALTALPVPARIVVEPDLGAARARNRGLREATGTVIAFLDDDAVPDDDWLARLVAPILAGRCDGTGGRVELDPSVPRPRWWAPWLAGYFSEFAPLPVEGDLREVPADSFAEPFVLTANAAFRASLLRAVGGFDPALGTRNGVPFGNEELMLCRRVFAANGVVRYVPGARVVHELPAPRLRLSYVWRRLYAQGRSDWMLDRDELIRHRTRGLRLGVDLLRSDFRNAVGADRKRPLALWLATAIVRRAGFAREAVAAWTPGRGAAR